MARVFSGIQPTGDVHLGNLLGALVRWADDQHRAESIYCVVDLHALTLPQDPEELRAGTLRMAQLLLAVGLDPDVCTLFVQSHVPEHTGLAWLMECTAAYGELSRMTQFKDKSGRAGFVSGGLFTYPALMAADILLYDTDEVPVGDDQRQHVELTRDLAERFNARHGPTFTVPRATFPPAGARVMDLQDPTSKMSKSADASTGTILVLDDPKVVERKIKRAVTDGESEVRFDVEAKPGVSNLLSILGAATGRTPEEAARGYSQYGPLKADTAAAVVERLAPIQARYAELAADPAETGRLLARGRGEGPHHRSRHPGPGPGRPRAGRAGLMDAVVGALQGQLDELEALLAPLDDEAWHRPSACPGWDISDVVLHLAQTNELAAASARGDLERVADGWGRAEGATVDDAAGDAVAGARGASPTEVHARWTASATAMVAAFAACRPDQRVPWVVGEMAARTLATTRVAETWIHTQDVAAGLDVEVPGTDRLWHVARLVHRTLPYAFARGGQDPPGPVRFALDGPGGDTWTFGPDDAPTFVTGPAVDLCHVAGQRATAAATALAAEGPDAESVLRLVRTFA